MDDELIQCTYVTFFYSVLNYNACQCSNLDSGQASDQCVDQYLLAASIAYSPPTQHGSQ